MCVKIKVVMHEGCDDLLPRKAHSDDAAFDLRSRVDMELPVGRSVVVPSGVYIELPEGYEAQVRPRSGLALKHNLMLFQVKRGDRIAQMVICRLPEVELSVVERLSESGRGAGGFGSTGRE